MYCANHHGVEPSGSCVNCGKLFCGACLVDVNNKYYCKNCVGSAMNGGGNTQNVFVSNNINIREQGVSDKSRLVAILLCWFLGYIGVHRFYVGKIGTGILYIFTFGLFGIGYIVDIIMIAMGSFRDANGDFVKNWNV